VLFENSPTNFGFNNEQKEHQRTQQKGTATNAEMCLLFFSQLDQNET